MNGEVRWRATEVEAEQQRRVGRSLVLVWPGRCLFHNVKEDIHYQKSVGHVHALSVVTKLAPLARWQPIVIVKPGVRLDLMAGHFDSYMVPGPHFFAPTAVEENSHSHRSVVLLEMNRNQSVPW